MKAAVQGKTTDGAPGELSKQKPVSEGVAEDFPKKSPLSEQDLELIEKFVESWADAWSRRDVDGYLSHYSPEFRSTSGRSFDEWHRQRKKRIQRPVFIEIEVDLIKTEITGASRARATFFQKYRSDTFEDRVMKVLDLVWEDNRWKIIREASKPIN